MMTSNSNRHATATLHSELQANTGSISATLVAETLEKYDIAPKQLQEWEIALGLSIPVSPQGEKLYSNQHLNLFKNVKKHLTLGRNLKQIKQLIQLPANTQSVAVTPAEAPTILPASTNTATVQSSSQPIPAQQQEAVANTTVSTNFKDAWQHSPNVPQNKVVFLELVEPTPSTTQSQQPASVGIEAPTNIPAVPAIEAMSHTPITEAFAHSAEALVAVSTVEATSVATPEANATVAPSQPAVTHQPSPPPNVDSAIILTATEAAPSTVATAITPASQSSASTILHAPTPATNTADANTTLLLVDKLLVEKEATQRKLIEAEKLNSHLYNVNNLFNRKVKELTQMVQQLKTVANEQQNMKLMEEKATLQRQLLDVERNKLEQQRAFNQEQQKVQQLSQQLAAIQQQWQELTTGFNPKRFVGHWQETLLLKQKVFDTFGLNVEPQRNQHRVFEVAPTRVAGNAGFFSFEYRYPDNAVWKRLEALSLVCVSENELVGEVSVDYVLDGVIVCRAIYQATLQRLPN
jgi:DNA-binding transcriptional MerR regulator